MSRRASFEERARAEVERIKAEERTEEERRQQRMRELAEESRERRRAEAKEEQRQEARRAKQEAEHQREKEERAKCGMFNSWVASGGAPEEFETAWPNLKREMLTQRTLEADTQARHLQRTSGVSRI